MLPASFVSEVGHSCLSLGCLPLPATEKTDASKAAAAAAAGSQSHEAIGQTCKDRAAVDFDITSRQRLASVPTELDEGVVYHKHAIGCLRANAMRRTTCNVAHHARDGAFWVALGCDIRHQGTFNDLAGLIFHANLRNAFIGDIDAVACLKATERRMWNSAVSHHLW